MHRIRIAGFAGLLTILVAACSSQPSTTPATSTTPIPSLPPASSAPALPSATESASAEASASVPALPSGLSGLNFHGAPDLEAVLPDTVNGSQVVKMSFNGEQLQQLGSAMGQMQFGEVMQQAGIDPSTVSVALGTVGSGDSGAQVSAMKAAGADASRLRQALENAAAKNASEKVTWGSETVGGKSVTTATVTTPERPAPTKIYVYVNGDTIFQVVATDANLAASLLTALP